MLAVRNYIDNHELSGIIYGPFVVYKLSIISLSISFRALVGNKADQLLRSQAI